MKESIQRAFSYLTARKVEFGLGREVDTTDLHVEVMDLLNNKVEAEVGRRLLRRRLLRPAQAPRRARPR